MAWIVARMTVMVAIRGCHLNGITKMPFLLSIEIEAVNRREKKVRTPPYIIRGFPKTNVYAMLLIIT